MAISKETNQKFAVKEMKTSSKMENRKNEIQLLKKMDHPYIIKLYDVFESSSVLFYVMEYFPSETLLSVLEKKERLPENEAKIIMRQAFSSIEYIHSLGIVHRNLKLEKFLCATSSISPVIKLIDFALSKIKAEKYSLMTVCGTTDSAAPEVLLGDGYGAPVDVWSLGVVMYTLLCGYTPFYGDTDVEIFRQILELSFSFPASDWNNISDQAKNLISQILVLEPETRLTATQCLAHPWFH
uniref:non-specific serine/threonine protein kinase n=1 Tax=Arcella intermedia TaxID=1963864 RepID=A0A6B2LDB9_9EUKA